MSVVLQSQSRGGGRGLQPSDANMANLAALGRSQSIRLASVRGYGGERRLIPSGPHRSRQERDMDVPFTDPKLDRDRLSAEPAHVPILRSVPQHTRDRRFLEAGVRVGVQDGNLDVRHGHGGVGVVSRSPSRNAQQRALGATPRPHSHDQPRDEAKIRGSDRVQISELDPKGLRLTTPLEEVPLGPSKQFLDHFKVCALRSYQDSEGLCFISVTTGERWLYDMDARFWHILPSSPGSKSKSMAAYGGFSIHLRVDIQP